MKIMARLIVGIFISTSAVLTRTSCGPTLDITVGTRTAGGNGGIIRKCSRRIDDSGKDSAEVGAGDGGKL